MDKTTNPELVADIVKNAAYPLVLKNVSNWPLLKWSLEEWAEHMPPEDLSFRCKPTRATTEPCWERNCTTKLLPFKKFVDAAQSNTRDWFYFDYKYMHQWLKPESEITKQIRWDAFGFPEAGPQESTMWIGSNGAHTPCHQDTYGRNIVLQVFGRKRWLLFPPECGGMKPTRVPYEESSIYSQLNFYLPANLSAFSGISGCRMVVLNPGDALVVPHRWWHYVEHVSDIGITINSWIPTEELDVESRVEEALTRLIFAQVCKDLPDKCLPYILNPNEDDLPDIPLSVNILQLETTVMKCLQQRTKKNAPKRIKLSESESFADASCSAEDASKTSTNKLVKNHFDLEKIIQESDNILVVKEITKDELIEILKENISKHSCTEQSESGSEDDEGSGDVLRGDHFTSAIIRALGNPSVIENVKCNLLNSFN